MPYIGNNHVVGDHVNNFKVLDDISSYTATFDGTAASVVSVANDTIRIPNHRFIQGQRVLYSVGGGDAIAGLADATPYFVVFDTSNTIKLATSLSNATSNNFVNLTGVASSGTSHTLNASFDGVNTKFKITHTNGKSARFTNPSQLNIAINNVIQRPNLNDGSFVDGFAVEHKEKIVFKSAPTSNDTFWGNLIGESIETFDISDLRIDNYTGDGSTDSFTISRKSPNSQSLMITLDGVLQHPTDSTTTRSYSLVGETVVEFTSPPANGVEIQIRHLGFSGATTSNVSGFYGRTGNVTLTPSDNITVGVLTASKITGPIVAGVGSSDISAGIITAVTGEFTNVTIGGTLVYEDVKNVDAIGLITARSGIKVGSGVTIEPNGQATFTGIVTFGSNSTTIGDNVINVGTALTLGHTQGVQFHTQNLHADGFEINNINASGIITAASIVATNLSANIPSGIGTALSTDNNSPLSRIFYNDAVLAIGSTITVNHPATADAAYTRFSDIRVDGDADLIVSDGDDFVPDVFGLNEFGTLGGGSGGRMRVDRITNAAGTGAVEIENGLVVAGVTTFSSGFSTPDQITHFGDTDTRIRFPSADTFAVETAGSERLRITGIGSVGINSTSPQTKLDVIAGSVNRTWTPGNSVVSMFERNGHCRITLAANPTSYSQIDFGDTNDDNAGYIKYDHNDDSMSFRAATSERLRITSTGNIGIGTDNPPEKLSIENGNIFIRDTSDNVSYIYFTHSPTANRRSYIGAVEGTGNSNSLVFATNGDGLDGAERLRITSDGKIGIGTDSPDSDAYIHIVGTDNGKIILEDNDNNGANLRKNYIGIQGSDNLVLAADEADLGTSSSIRFRIDNTEKVRITSAGRVGIGTDSPLSPSKLHISSGDEDNDCVVIIEADADNNDENANPQIWFKQDAGVNASFVGNDSNKLVISNNISVSGGISFRTGTTSNTGSTSPITSSEERMSISSAGYVSGNVNVPCWYGNQDTSYSIGNATWIKVYNLGTNPINPAANNGGWDESSGRFTVQAGQAGTYILYGGVGIDDIQANDYVQCRFYKNGSGVNPIHMVRNAAGTNQITDVQNQTMINLAEGDYVEFYVYHNEGSSEPTEPNRTFFGGYRLAV